uniref:Uncharacterized protein n=1 Tax=Octopus bimaculoides TaxID=37653 RepID=A0A0L8HJP9_OCTBM
MKSFGFGLRTFKRFPELLPLVGFITFAVTMGSSFAVYSLLTKPDVRLFGRDTEMPYDLVKPTESRKSLPFIVLLASINGLRPCWGILGHTAAPLRIVSFTEPLGYAHVCVCVCLVNINEKYVPIPELEQLKKEIGSFKN